MRFASHLIVASGAFAVFVSYKQSALIQQPITLFTYYLFVLVGCCLPDIDHPSSTIGRRVTFVSYPIRLIFGHRGITHSLLAVAILAYSSSLVGNLYLSWMTFGYAMHLLGDFLTDSGIPALYPSRRRYRFILVGSTGGLSEVLMVSLFSLACGLLITFKWEY